MLSLAVRVYLWSYFQVSAGQIIAISVKESRRHDLLANHLAELNVGATISPSVFLKEPVSDVITYDDAQRLKILGYSLTTGEVGCFLAHRSAWELVAAGSQPCLVIEDDARLTPQLVSSLDELKHAITGTQIIVRLFSKRHPRTKRWRRLASGLEIVRPLTPGYSAVAYLLDPLAAKSLLISSSRFWQTVDNHMDDEPSHGCIIMHVLPELVRHEDEGHSLIGNRSKPSLTPWTKARRELSRALRNLKLMWHREKTLRSLGLRWSQSW